MGRQVLVRRAEEALVVVFPGEVRDIPQPATVHKCYVVEERRIEIGVLMRRARRIGR